MSSKTLSFQARMVKKPPFTREVKNVQPVEGETIPRRNARYPELLTTPDPEISTLYDVIKRSASKFGDAKAVGSRKLIKTHHEIKKIKKLVNGKTEEVDKKWTYFELGPFEYMSFREFFTLALQLGAGLRKLGLVSHDRVHLFASTSAHWLSMAHGAMSQSMATVTAYDTLGEDGLRHSLLATKAKVIFLEPHLLKTFINILKDAKEIEYIIYNTDSEHEIKEEDLDILRKSHAHLQVMSFEDLRVMGQDNPSEPVPPKAEDLACIMYTSGSGGTPKGVELKHSNIVAAIAGANSIAGDYLGPNDSMLTYLPLAHIFEFMFENAALFWGSVMGYGSIRTLSAANCRNCKGDIQEFRPTILVGIPAVWETVKKGVLSNVTASPKAVQALFWGALAAKKSLLHWGIPGSLVLDAVVFKKVKEATGGRLRFVMSGAAPIARDTQEFISLAICPVIMGYGMTETSAMGSIGDPLSWTPDSHGEPPGSIEIKLVDYPEAGYYAINKPNQQGEIWIRGASVMERYYGMPELSADAIAPGGWFKTGDIGEWDRNGHLKVIDRKKNLVKTLNGEYIALEKLESVYRSGIIVANICIYASITETKPIAIIVPVEAALKKLADTLGVQGHGIEDLVHDRRIQEEILKQLQAVGRKAGLANIELIQGLVLSDEEWTPLTNMVTPTNKLNRKVIETKYKKEIDAAYGKA